MARQPIIPPNTLKKRIFWRCFILLIFLVVGLTTTAVISESQHFQTTSKSFYSGQARLLSIQISDQVLWNDRINLLKRLQRTVSSDQAISYAYITKNGKPLVYTFEKGFPEGLQQLRLGDKRNIAIETVKGASGVKFNHIMVQIEASDAVLHFGILRSELNRRTMQNIEIILGMALLALFIGGIFSRYIAKITTLEVERSDLEIKQERHFLQTVIDAVVDPIRVITRDRKIVLMNRAAHIQEGCTAFKNIYCNENYCAKRDDNNLCPLDTLHNCDDATRLTQRRRQPDGSESIFEVDIAPLCDQGNFKGIVQVTRDITNRLQLEAKLHANESRLVFMAQHDLLTNLPNRDLILDRLITVLSAKDSQSKATLLIIGLDRFKKINEEMGRDIGDKVLALTAHRLAKCITKNETLARLSGDEFCVVIDNSNSVNSAARAAKRLLEQFQQPLALAGCELHLSASIGISLYPDDGSSPAALIKNADIAMTRAKKEGKGHYQFFEQGMTQHTTNFFKMENDLRTAITNNELQVYYQPQIDLASGSISGMEALLRWNHPQLGQIPPLDFIPIAEESGLIVPIGLWILEEACRQVADWKQRNISTLTVAVNLSAAQFAEEDLITSISTAINKSGIDPAQLELEITESMIMHNVDTAITTMKAINQLGVKLSIDDFGTGYSSLSYLRYFPLAKLKIDKSFIEQVTSNSQDAALASSVIALAHSLNLKVVAEGIETEEQAEFLRQRSCHQGQGFLFSKPILPHQLETFLVNKYQY
jgi:diguanylate cyclase (GGDEF)-like protein/PAS domain S-box-containing protein